MNDIFVFLDEALDIERTVRDIYVTFGNMDTMNEDARHFWARMAIGEKEHIHLLENQKKIYTLLKREFGNIKQDISVLKKTNEELKNTLQQISKNMITFEEAIKIAEKIETSIPEIFFKDIMQIRTTELKETIDYLCQDSHNHKKLLQDAKRQIKSG